MYLHTRRVCYVFERAENVFSVRNHIIIIIITTIGSEYARPRGRAGSTQSAGVLIHLGRVRYIVVGTRTHVVGRLGTRYDALTTRTYALGSQPPWSVYTRATSI